MAARPMSRLNLRNGRALDERPADGALDGAKG
jgi:hypothetical protein